MKPIDRSFCVVELARWDLMGKKTGQPDRRPLGLWHAQILAYGFTMCGDHMERALPHCKTTGAMPNG